MCIRDRFEKRPAQMRSSSAPSNSGIMSNAETSAWTSASLGATWSPWAAAMVASSKVASLDVLSDATLLEATIAAAQGDHVAPSDAEVQADVSALDMMPLFDGAELERI